jgi:hypothetical protein
MNIIAPSAFLLKPNRNRKLDDQRHRNMRRRAKLRELERESDRLRAQFYLLYQQHGTQRQAWSKLGIGLSFPACLTWLGGRKLPEKHHLSMGRALEAWALTSRT